MVQGRGGVKAFFTLPWRGRVGACNAPGWGELLRSFLAPRSRVLKQVTLGGVRTIERGIDGLHHAIDVLSNVVVPKADDTIAFGFKPLRPLLVTRAAVFTSMLRTIHFNDEAGGRTGKIGDEVSDRHLTTKVRALCFQAFEPAP